MGFLSPSKMDSVCVEKVGEFVFPGGDHPSANLGFDHDCYV